MLSQAKLSSIMDFWVFDLDFYASSLFPSTRCPLPFRLTGDPEQTRVQIGGSRFELAVNPPPSP
jgi:hypothetical protein